MSMKILLMFQVKKMLVKVPFDSWALLIVTGQATCMVGNSKAVIF